MRRNVDLKILLFNNRIYGLTKGQYSPTSEVGKRSPSTPLGSVDNPSIRSASPSVPVPPSWPVAVDTDTKHLQEVIKKRCRHRGTAFVEIYQNCNVFNDGAFVHFTEKEARADKQLLLEQGKPLLFGKDRDQGIRLSQGGRPRGRSSRGRRRRRVGRGPAGPRRHPTRTRATPSMLSQLDYPAYPVPVGVLRAVEAPSTTPCCAPRRTWPGSARRTTRT